MGNLSEKDSEYFDVEQDIIRLDLRSRGITQISQKITGLLKLKWLFMINNSIQEIPGFINQLVSLETLNLSANRIYKVPAGMGRLEVLRSVNLSQNRIRDVPSCFGELVSLQDLDLSFNLIKRLPEELGNLKRLKRFSISRNYIQVFPDWKSLEEMTYFDASINLLDMVPEFLANCPKLETVVLNCNRINCIKGEILISFGNLSVLELKRNLLMGLPDEICYMTELKNLSLRSNQIISLPVSISSLISLVELDISQNGLEYVPDTIGELTNLKTLILTKNNIQDIPFSLNKMESLKDVVLSENHVNVLGILKINIEIHFQNLKNLESIDISNSKISILDEYSLNGLDGLIELKINDNSISEIPDLLRNTPNLRRLDGGNNSLMTLPPIPTGLGTLELPGNQFLEFPPTIFECVNLSIINLHGNNLTEIPSEIGSLTNLIMLYLGQNEISYLPDAFANLKRLQILHLDSNKFEDFPLQLLELSILQELSLSNNLISIIPEEISSLITLRKLYIDVNRIEHLPDSFCGLINLTDLNLSQNLLFDLPVNFGKITLIDIDLSGNNLIELPDSLTNCLYIRQLKLSYNNLISKPSLRRGWCISNMNPFDTAPPSAEEMVKKTLQRRRKFGWSEMCGRRPDQQDTILIQEKFFGKHTTLICCFDGHGGEKTAEFAATYFPDHLLSSYIRNGMSTEQFRLSFSSFNEKIRGANLEDGAAALCVIVDEHNKRVVVANAGDERAVLCRNGRAIAITEDHKPDTDSEKKRIYDVGGYITANERVNGVLALSRSIGDLDLQPFVSCEPEMYELKIRSDCEFIIVACDGVWDVLSNQKAVDIVRCFDNASSAASSLINYAHCAGSGDNISAIVYYFR